MKIRHNNKSIIAFEIAILAIVLLFALLLWRADSIIQWIYTAVFSFALAIAAIKIFGLPKDNHFLRKASVKLIISNYVVLAIMLFIIGCFTGFSDSIDGIMMAIPIIAATVSFELMRHSLLHNRQMNKWVLFSYIVTATIFKFVVTDYFSFSFDGILAVLLSEILLCFMSRRVGFAPCLVYQVLFVTMVMLPVAPILSVLLFNLISIALPLLTLLVIYYQSQFSERDIVRASRYNVVCFTIPVIIILAFFAVLSVGKTNIQMMAIMSDSMQPAYGRGDVVIFEKISAEELREGDILVFNRGNQTITHRIVDIKNEEDNITFIVKGDNNDSPDEYQVSKNDVRGKVQIHGKYLGYPSVWLSEIFGAKQ